MGDIAILKTKKEFVFVFGENIHGPFPSTEEMVDSILFLLKDPSSEEAIRRCVQASKVPVNMVSSRKTTKKQRKKVEEIPK